MKARQNCLFSLSCLCLIHQSHYLFTYLLVNNNERLHLDLPRYDSILDKYQWFTVSIAITNIKNLITTKDILLI